MPSSRTYSRSLELVRNILSLSTAAFDQHLIVHLKILQYEFDNIGFIDIQQ